MKKQFSGQKNYGVNIRKNNMYTKAKQEIKKMLDSFSITSAPINIEAIVKKLGIEISYAPSIDYSGILIRKSDGCVLMGINNNESLGRMRFSTAHELGHYLLHKDSVTIDYRSKQHLTKKPKKEVLADYFAANLLMPEIFIKEDFKNSTKNGVFFEQNLIELADKYQVSNEAMKYRLINLKLIPNTSNINLF